MEIEDTLRSIEKLARLAASAVADVDYSQTVIWQTSLVLKQLQEAEQLLTQLSSEPCDDLRELLSLSD